MFRDIIKQKLTQFEMRVQDKYEFLPKASEEEILSFEEKYGVVLPNEYKWFVCNIANGILDREHNSRHILRKVHFANYFSREKDFNPGLPFELTERYELTLGQKQKREFTNGHITLESDGGASTVLIINGPEYGNMWIDNYMSNSEVYPCIIEENGSKRYTFVPWLLERLDWLFER